MQQAAGTLMVLLASAGVAAQGAAKIAPRDQVSVVVFGEERMSGKFSVDPEGQFALPYIGTVRAAGMTARELEAEIGKRLKEQGIYTTVPQITVEITQAQTKKVMVTGAVRSPSQIAYGGELTVLDALVRAGSPTTDAGDEVLIIRPSQNGTEQQNADVISVNLAALTSGNIAQHNVTLQDGDTLIVQKAESVFITGAVRSQGPYRIEPNTSVRKALALAGGLTERGTSRGIRILRDNKDVKDVNQDTIVKPGDTIIVKTSVF
jgi:polysaccharide biosynthesis/export protein